MENKRTRIEGSDTDKAIAKVGRSKTNKLKTDEPLAEQKTALHNKPHMLFR